jgi:hypothetical protein
LPSSARAEATSASSRGPQYSVSAHSGKRTPPVDPGPAREKPVLRWALGAWHSRTV